MHNLLLWYIFKVYTLINSTFFSQPLLIVQLFLILPAPHSSLHLIMICWKDDHHDEKKGREREKWFICNNNLILGMFLIGPNDGGLFLYQVSLAKAFRIPRGSTSNCLFLNRLGKWIINSIRIVSSSSKTTFKVM